MSKLEEQKINYNFLTNAKYQVISWFVMMGWAVMIPGTFVYVRVLTFKNSEQKLV
jgi:predicted ABC-type sugar transport system permease subunit